MAEVKFPPRTRVVFPNSVPEIRGPVWKVIVGPIGKLYLVERPGRRGPFIPEPELEAEAAGSEATPSVTTKFDPGDAVRDRHHRNIAGVVELIILHGREVDYHVEGWKEPIKERYAEAVEEPTAGALRARHSFALRFKTGGKRRD